MMKGVDPNKPIVIDVEDKITSLAEADTMENRLALIKRTMNSLIGETSNCATRLSQQSCKERRTKEKI